VAEAVDVEVDGLLVEGVVEDAILLVVVMVLVGRDEVVRSGLSQMFGGGVL
jgi:hypothetical protein